MSAKKAKRERRDLQRKTDAMFGRVLAGLKAVFDRTAPAYFEAHPDARMCGSCGLNPKTWDREGRRGFDSTMVGVIGSLQTGRPFLCHSTLPRREDDLGWKIPDGVDPLTLPRCQAFEALKTDRVATLAAVWRGMSSRSRNLTDEQAADVVLALPPLDGVVSCQIGPDNV